MQQQVNDPIWQVVLQIEKNYMMVYKGQEVTEFISAPDRDKAIEKALRVNDMEMSHIPEVATVKGVRQLEEHEEFL